MAKKKSTDGLTQGQLFGVPRHRKSRIWSEEEEAADVSSYLAGQDTCATIASRRGCCLVAAWNMLRRNGVQPQNRRYKLTPETREAVVERYLTGESPSLIAAEYGIDRSSIRSLLRSRKIKTIHPTGSPRSYSINVGAFDAMTDEAQYWLGFLLADGCILDGKSLALQVGLMAASTGHLEKLRDFLGTDAPIRQVLRCCNFGEYPSAVLTVWSVDLCQSLMQFGVHPRKSGSEEVPGGLEQSRHFWRGLIDGDGCLSWTKKDRGPGREAPSIAVISTLRVVRQFLGYAKALTGTNATPVSQPGCYAGRVSGWLSIPLIRLLYENAPVSLDQKQAIADEMIRRASERESI